MRHLILVLAALTLAGPAAAQTPTTVPPPSAPGLPPANGIAPRVTVNPQLLLGRWQFTRDDAETRSIDQIVIEFLKDGRYAARFHNTLFPGDEHLSNGRFAILGLQANSLDIRIERNLEEPESDPRDAVETQRITVIDANTLQAADGSIARRIK